MYLVSSKRLYIYIYVL